MGGGGDVARRAKGRGERGGGKHACGAKGGGVYRTTFARKRTREKRRYAHAKAAGRGCAFLNKPPPQKGPFPRLSPLV